MADYPEFPKIARLTRECTITEKLDGTNALIRIDETGENWAIGSRSRFITPEDDNYGFARWAYANKAELMRLGPGNHYGEYWGTGIQKRYVNASKTFSLFNTKRWSDDAVRPACCAVVPILYQGIFSGEAVDKVLDDLRANGSMASPECKRPEGIIIWHHAAQMYFKKTLERDAEWNGKPPTTPPMEAPRG